MYNIKTFHVRLSNEEKLGIQQCFFDMYYNTDQDASLYGEEYYYVSAEIMQGNLPISLKYLSTEFIEILVEKFEFLKEYYKVYDDKIKDTQVYIESMNDGVTYNCDNNVEDMYEVLKEEYYRGDICLAEFLESISIHNASVADVVRVFNKAFEKIEGDRCTRFTKEGDELDLI